ncbi:UNVERIFIED_CONTAM: hypothetical protein RMT77_019784 [Armadillidium vulgare]
MDQHFYEGITYFTYDLSTNYVFEQPIRFLKETCSWIAVLNSYQSNEAVQEIRRMLLNQDLEDTSNLFVIVELNVLRIEILPNRLVNEIRVVIRLVYNEIKRFLATIFLEADKLLFVGNFDFNCQGGINPRETVLRVINSNNTFSLREQFEFSCKYLFDEKKVYTYFVDLIPHNIDGYFIYGDGSLEELHIDLIHLWIWKFSESSYIPDDERVYDDIEYFKSIFFHEDYQFSQCTELAVHYSLENTDDTSVLLGIRNLVENNNFVFYIGIFDRLMLEPESHRINISIYLITRLGLETLFPNYAYEIVTKLAKNSRWYDTFNSFFLLLRPHVPTRKYISLTYTVLTEMWSLIKIEGNYGKYNNIWNEFDQLVPIRGRNFMKETYLRVYARKVFELFEHKDSKLIHLLLSIDIRDNEDTGNAFYELAKKYFKLFADFCCKCSNLIESFLVEIIQSEEKVSYLLMRLYFRSPYLLHAAELRGILLWDETQPFMEWYFNMCISIEDIRIVVSEQMSSLKALIKIEYADQFLNFIIINNQLLIFYKRRFVKNIQILSRERHAQMFCYPVINIANANRF